MLWVKSHLIILRPWIFVASSIQGSKFALWLLRRGGGGSGEFV